MWTQMTMYKILIENFSVFFYLIKKYNTCIVHIFSFSTIPAMFPSNFYFELSHQDFVNFYL